MTVRVRPLARWNPSSETFFDAVHTLGLGPGWRLHVIEDPARFVHVFHLTNDLTDAHYSMELERADLENSVDAQQRILDWIQESAVPPVVGVEDDQHEHIEALLKTRRIELDD